MRRLVEAQYNQLINDTISEHFSLFGSTQMAALVAKLEAFKADLKAKQLESALWLTFNGKDAFDALGVDEVVLVVAVLHDFNESSIHEVYQALNIDMDELFQVFGAAGRINIKNVNGRVLTHSDFEREAFKAMTYQPSIMTPAAERLIFQGTSPLAGFVASGASEGFIQKYLSRAEAQSLVTLEHQDRVQILGWLAGHCSDLNSLPNRSAAHFLRAVGAFHPNLLKKETVASCFWEDLLYNVAKPFAGASSEHTVAQEIFETLADDQFLELHRDGVTGMFDNLMLQARYEKVDDEAAFAYLRDAFEQSQAWPLIQKPHVLMNLARNALNVGFYKHVTEPVAFDMLEASSPSLARALEPYRADLFNQVLESQLHIEDRYFGIAPLVCPFGIRQINEADKRKKPDPELLKRYLIKTLPIAAHFTRSVPESTMDRDGMCVAVLNTYRYLVDEALKIKKFDWSFESGLADDQRVFLVKAGLPISRLEKSTGTMREAALGVDLGL